MRPPWSIISEKIAVHILLRWYPLYRPHPLWLDWIAEIAAELSGSLQQRRGNLGSAGSLILFTLLLLPALVVLWRTQTQSCRYWDKLWGGGVSALWIIASKLNFAENDNGQDILHGQMFVGTWILHPYGIFEAATTASPLLGRLSTRFCLFILSYSASRALDIEHWC